MIAQHIHTAAVGLKTLNLSMKFTVTLLQKVVTEDFITLRHTSKYLEEKAPYTATIYCTSKTECYKIPYKKKVQLLLRSLVKKNVDFQAIVSHETSHCNQD